LGLAVERPAQAGGGAAGQGRGAEGERGTHGESDMSGRGWPPRPPWSGPAARTVPGRPAGTLGPEAGPPNRPRRSARTDPRGHSTPDLMPAEPSVELPVVPAVHV